MTTDNPITPPPELVEQWIAQIWHEGTPVKVAANDLHVATQAARWGADRELDECCEWCADGSMVLAKELLAARRPKPPSLAEQALALISHDPENQPFLSEKGIAIIRRALERLQKLEQQLD